MFMWQNSENINDASVNQLNSLNTFEVTGEN